jgi:FkbM family methyltransferase
MTSPASSTGPKTVTISMRSAVLAGGLAVLVLVLETVRCSTELDRLAAEREQLEAAPAAATEQAPAPVAKLAPKPQLPPDFDPSINEPDPANLAPRMLQDLEEIAAYVEAFPADAYRVHEVPGQGSFHLDSGGDLIKDMLRQGFPWEPEVAEILTQLIEPGTTVLDIGAHIGTHTVTMSRLVGDGGRVYAFEPQRKVYRELVHNMRINGADNVRPLRYALGSETAIIEMSPAVKGNEGHTSIGEGGDQVELRSVDSFGFRNVSFMKIDVEGFEDPVIEGASATIAANRPALIVEIQGDQGFDDAKPPERAKIVDTIRTIEEMGYHVIRISPFDYMGLPIEPEVAPAEAAD